MCSRQNAYGSKKMEVSTVHAQMEAHQDQNSPVEFSLRGVPTNRSPATTVLVPSELRSWLRGCSSPAPMRFQGDTGKAKAAYRTSSPSGKTPTRYSHPHRCEGRIRKVSSFLAENSAIILPAPVSGLLGHVARHRPPEGLALG